VGLFLVSLVSIAGIAGGYVFNVVVQGVTPARTSRASLRSRSCPTLLVDGKGVGVRVSSQRMVACYKGLYAKGGRKGVVDAVNQAVVITFILIFFANFIMTSLYLALVPQKFLMAATTRVARVPKAITRRARQRARGGGQAAQLLRQHHG